MATGATDGVLFKGVQFFIGQRVPQRSTYIEKVRKNGGVVVPLEKQAKVQIADHLRASQNAPGTTSYEWIDRCIEAGELLDPAAHPAGPVERTTRAPGALNPGKSSRVGYTAADDLVLYNHVKACERQGKLVKGNEIYMQLEKTNPRHPWQSWRDRWVKYLSVRAPPAGAELPTGASPTSTTPNTTTTNTRAVIPNTSRTQIQQDTRGPSGTSPEVAVIIPAAAQPHARAEPPQVTPSHIETHIAPLSTTDYELLMAHAPDIEQMSVGRYDRGWKAFAQSHTRHTAGQWKRYYEDFVQPEYRRNALDTSEEEQEDGVEADVEETIPVSSPFVDVMKMKTPSRTGKRKLDSSPHELMENGATHKRQRLSSASDKQADNHAEGDEDGEDGRMDIPNNGGSHGLEPGSRAEKAHPTDVSDHIMEHTNNLPQSTFRVEDSQQSWQGLSPVREVEEEQPETHGTDAVPEGDEENYYVDENGAHKILSHHEMNEQSPRAAIPALRDVTQEFVVPEATQTSMDEWHDAQEDGSNHDPGIDGAMTTAERPGLWTQVAQLDVLNEDEVEDVADIDGDRDQEEVDPDAQFDRESSQDGDPQDEEKELQDGKDDLIETNENEAFPIHEDSRSPEKLSVEPINFDSDQLLPPDSSVADDEELATPTPRKRKAPRTYTAPFGEEAESDIEDYTIMAPPADSDVGLFNAATDEPLPSIEDYVDTQAVLQADTQALDADVPLPAQTQNINQYSQWVKEQRLQLPNSDIAPSSPGSVVVVPSSTIRSRATAATAARKARETSTSFVHSDDSLPSLPRQIQALPITTKAVGELRSSHSPAGLSKESSARPATTKAPTQPRSSQPPAVPRRAVFRRPDERRPRPQEDDYVLPRIGDDDSTLPAIGDGDDIHEVSAPIAVPSSSAPTKTIYLSTAPPSGTPTSSTDRVQAFIEYHVKHGRTKEELEYCLQRTSYDGPLAMRVLNSLGRGRGVPQGFKGIWTEEDDEFMLQIIRHGEKGYHRMHKVELVGLHGIQAFRDRMKDLKAWNE